MADAGEVPERFKEIDAVLHIIKELKRIKRPFRLSDLHLLLANDSEVKRFLQSKWRLCDLGAFVTKFRQHFIVQEDETVLLRNPDFTIEQLQYITDFLKLMSGKKILYDYLNSACFVCSTNCLEDMSDRFYSVHDFFHIHNLVTPPKLAENEQDAEATELKVPRLPGANLSAKQMEYKVFMEKKAVNFFHQLVVNRRSVPVRQVHSFANNETEICGYLQEHYTLNNLESFFKRYPEKFLLESGHVRPKISQNVSSPQVSDLAKKEEYRSRMEKRVVDFYLNLLEERYEISVKQAHSFLQGDDDLRAYLKKKYRIGNLTAFFQKYPEKFLLINEHVYPLIHDEGSESTSSSGSTENLAQACASNVDAPASSSRSTKESLIKDKVTSDSSKQKKDSKSDNNASIPSRTSSLDTKRVTRSLTKNEETPMSPEKDKNVSVLNQLSLFNANQGKGLLMKSKETPGKSEEELGRDVVNNVSLPSRVTLVDKRCAKPSLVKNIVVPESFEEQKESKLNNNDASLLSQFTLLDTRHAKESVLKNEVALEGSKEQRNSKLDNNDALLSNQFTLVAKRHAKSSLVENEVPPDASEEEKYKNDVLIRSQLSSSNADHGKGSSMKNQVSLDSAEDVKDIELNDNAVSEQSQLTFLNSNQLKESLRNIKVACDHFEEENDKKNVSLLSWLPWFNRNSAKESLTKNEATPERSSLLSWFSLFNRNRGEESLIKNEVTEESSEEGKDENVSVLSQVSLLQAKESAMKTKVTSDNSEVEKDSKLDNEDASVPSMASFFYTSHAKESVITKKEISDDSEEQNDSELDNEGAEVLSRLLLFDTNPSFSLSCENVNETRDESKAKSKDVACQTISSGPVLHLCIFEETENS